MLSEEGQRIHLWLLQNIKNASLASSIHQARAGLDAIASRKPLPTDTKVEAVNAGRVPNLNAQMLYDSFGKDIVLKDKRVLNGQLSRLLRARNQAWFVLSSSWFSAVGSRPSARG